MNLRILLVVLVIAVLLFYRLIARLFGIVIVPEDSVGVVNRKYVVFGQNRTLYVKHDHDGRDLHIEYAEKSLNYLQRLWGREVVLETVLDDPATAETISMEGASRVGSAGIDGDGADFKDGAAAGAKDSCWPFASKKEPSLPIELSSKDPALV